MTEPTQLLLEGGEVPLSETQTNVERPLSQGQREIIAAAIRMGCLIRPVQAGTILHSFRYGGGHWHSPNPGLEGCCAYASTDGVDALKRLIRRGIFERVSKGLYALTGE